jgi:hypothetical protein
MYICVKGIDFVYVFTIFALDFKTVLRERYFLFFILSMNWWDEGIKSM